MNPATPSPPTGTGAAKSVDRPGLSPPPKKRRHWLRWVLGLVFILLALIFFLPNIVALPMFRQRLVQRAAERVDCSATVGNLSLAWLSPVHIDDFKLQPDETDRAALSIATMSGSKSLVQMLFGHELGTFKVEQPELYVEFNQNGTNITRLLRALSGSAIIKQPAQLEIVGGRLLLRGKDSPKPWEIGGMNLSVGFTPAAQSASGASELSGGQAKLLSQMELTPDMCNDLFKYVIPLLAQTTRTSGRVSLELDQFVWPLGKTDATELKGRLTLHSVDASPGPLTKALAGLLAPGIAAGSVQIAKDDVVTFNMHAGRVYHENLSFSLAGIQATSHGSVGMDETLDWSVEFQLHALEGLDIAEHPWLRALGEQRPTLHFTGTLSKPDWKVEGITVPNMRALIDLIRRHGESHDAQPQPGVPPESKQPLR